MAKIAVLTGGSAGIGLSAARLLAESGWTVYELSRSGKDGSGIIHVGCDVSDTGSVRQAVQTVLAQAPSVDLLVCNAGYGISGAVEFTDPADFKRQFDVNFFGAADVTRQLIPALRESSGKIIMLGSVAGLIPIPFQAYYSASKAAVAALCSALRSELRPFGVSVSCVLPGDVRTQFTSVREKKHAGDDIYQGRIARSVAVMEKDEENGMPPEKVAKIIVGLANSRRPRAVRIAGASYAALSLIARLLPEGLVSAAVGKMYGG